MNTIPHAPWHLTFLFGMWLNGALLGTEIPTKPNIIVIFTDDHGYADLGTQRILADVKTPHIDKLAASGARMESGYVSAPQCVPSRAGLLSGMYQNRFGVESNGLPLAGFDAQQTIAERLKHAGYATGMSGKWHLGPAPSIISHGFDDVYYKNSNRPGWANFDLDGSDREGGAEDSRLYHLDANSAAACTFIRRHKDEPFFFYCAYRAPHVPLDAPPKYLKRFPGKMPQRRRQALAMLSAIDDGVRDIMATLRDLKLEERTLIFIIGDNGAPLKIHKVDAPGGGPGWDGSLNDPLNGEKGMLSEGGIRVPFIAYWKGQIRGGQIYRHPVISLDVAATATALAGLPVAPKLDGVNLMPFLNGEASHPPHPTLYWRWIAQSAVREGKWKYLRGGKREYLYDLDEDREEKKNLLQRYPEVADKLKTKLAAWSQELKPPGLATASKSKAWERYFDHYLDGKTVPLPATPTDSARQDLKGWVVRNGTAKVSDGGLQVSSSRKQRRTFIARSRINVPPKSVVIVRMRTSAAGMGSIAWRHKDQKIFPSEQAAGFKCVADRNETYRVTLPADREVIHLRLVLPGKQINILSIELKQPSGKTVNRWNFVD